MWLPRLDRDRRVQVAERLMSGARCDVDFLLLMSMATSLAGLGLIQSSTPVVVGAMLVAPLMSPLLAAGLALVQANQSLLKQALRTLAFGFLVAVGFGLAMGLISFALGILDHDLSPELLARGRPTLLDLGVALVSGFAAAYAVVRNDLVAALAGVAIAAALVPPVATIGIAAMLGNMAVAQGALLLFAVNVVAVILGSGAALSLLGIGATRSAVPLWLRRAVLMLITMLLVLAVPLSSFCLTMALAPPTSARFAKWSSPGANNRATTCCGPKCYPVKCCAYTSACRNCLANCPGTNCANCPATRTLKSCQCYVRPPTNVI